MTRLLTFSLSFTLGFALVLTACGPAGSADQDTASGADAGSLHNPGDAGSSDDHTTGTFTCCLNGSFYNCPNQSAFQLCAGGDPATCHEKCGMDFACHDKCDQDAMNATHDPSKCNRENARDGECTTSTLSCQESLSAKECTYSTQCSSGNCTKGRCYGNANGQLCTYSTQCSSGNCTDGCCRGNGVGASCTYSTQCDSSNCTNGKCAGNSRGSACTYSTQCTSGSCVNGKCQ